MKHVGSKRKPQAQEVQSHSPVNIVIDQIGEFWTKLGSLAQGAAPPQPSPARPPARPPGRAHKASDPGSCKLDVCVRLAGGGWFQVVLTLYTGLYWIADAAETTTMTYLTPSVKCYWGSTSGQASLLASIAFIGQIVRGALRLWLDACTLEGKHWNAWQQWPQQAGGRQAAPHRLMPCPCTPVAQPSSSPVF